MSANEYTNKCCYFEIQAYCHQAFVRSKPVDEAVDEDIDDNNNNNNGYDSSEDNENSEDSEDSGDNGDSEDSEDSEDFKEPGSREVAHLSGMFTHLYGICCRVLWQVVGRDRFADRLEREEAAEKVAKEIVVQLVDQASKGPDEEAVNGPSSEAVSHSDKETTEDPEEAVSNPGDKDLINLDDEAANEVDEKGKVIASFYNRLKDCKCLEAVLVQEFGLPKHEKLQKLKKKANKLQAWRRRKQGIATEDDLLKPSPLRLPPITPEPDTN
ncbi:hypothetical protein F5Y13DRAFT_160279 [Hypoxylon sp. FL1857]|nr:hypothetical protein F5Y13DRAFT_160279 [Hypoxylon sp. FL1857]